MAGLARKTSIEFGGAGTTSNFGQFGSKEAGFPQTSKDPAVIQALSEWTQGWTTAVVSGDKAAYIEDMNGYCLTESYLVTYLYQMGISEWDSATLYFTGSVIQVASTGQQFKSLQGGVPGVGAGQSGNTPPAGASNAFWLWTNPPQDLVGAATLNTIPKVTSTAPSSGVPGSVTLSDSQVSEDGTNVIIGLPLKFPDNTVQATSAQPVSNQAVVTGSRNFNTVFHNTTGRPMWVSVVGSGGSGFVGTAYADSSITPTTAVSSISLNGATSGMPLMFIVLPGYYYKVTSAQTLVIWTEWT